MAPVFYFFSFFSHFFFKVENCKKALVWGQYLDLQKAQHRAPAKQGEAYYLQPPSATVSDWQMES